MAKGRVMKEKLKELRESKNWTQQDLADHLNVSIHTVKSWSRKTNPKHPNKWLMPKINRMFQAAGIEEIK